MLDESDMVRVEYLTGTCVPEVVGFCMWGIANEDARGGSLEDFWVMGLDKGKCSASNFAEVGQGGFAIKPKFIGSLSI